MKILTLVAVMPLALMSILSLTAHASADLGRHRNNSTTIRVVLTTDSTYGLLTLSNADTVLLTAWQEAQLRKINPRRATIRSLMLPGLGQIYNRQYWKLSVIYGGLGVAIAVYSWNQNLYSQYLAGYREAFNSTEINPQLGDKAAIVRGELRSLQYLKGATAQFQRQRTLTVILTVAGWALNGIEANVAAHMRTFDISDDISMRVSPNVTPIPGVGIVPGVRVVMTLGNLVHN